MIQTKCEGKHLTWFRASLLHLVPQVHLKVPMPMDTNLQACDGEANQNSINMPRLKRRLQVILWAQKGLRSQSECPISKIFPGGACPQIPLAYVLTHAFTNLGTSVSKPDESNFASAGPIMLLGSVVQKKMN